MTIQTLDHKTYKRIKDESPNMNKIFGDEDLIKIIDWPRKDKPCKCCGKIMKIEEYAKEVIKLCIHSWNRKKYCSEECINEIRKQRNRARKKDQKIKNGTENPKNDQKMTQKALFRP